MPTYRCKIPPTPEGVSVRTLLHLGSFFWECPHPWALVLDSKENEKKIPQEYIGQGFIGLAYQGKDIVYRFIIEYSSLRDFGSQVIMGLFLHEDF